MAEHKYAELANQLREDIQSGVYGNGQKLPSENELSALTSYSRQTVRQAIGVLEKEGCIERVQGSGTFVRIAPRRREQTHNIAIVTTYIGEYIFPKILDEIEAALSENGYTSMLSATRNRVVNERRILKMLLEKPIDGLIVEGTKTALPNPNIDLYKEFDKRRIPIVFLHGSYPELGAVQVVANDRAGGRMACEVLLKSGRRRIAGIFKSDDIQGHHRYAGYIEALQRNDLPVEDDHVLWYTTETMQTALEVFAAQTINRCNAVVCYNDEVARALLPVLQRLGIHVPEQMQLVSFDNSTYAQLAPKPVVSLTGPTSELGRLAAQKLIGMIKGSEQKSAVLPWRLEES